jgi:hypothetical protein
MTTLNSKGSLIVMSLWDEIGSKAFHERSWKQFKVSGTNHTSRAQTLARIINRCEREGVAYRLTAQPGLGYYIEPLDKDKK